jgi:hypothetical protein
MCASGLNRKLEKRVNLPVWRKIPGCGSVRAERRPIRGAKRSEGRRRGPPCGPSDLLVDIIYLIGGDDVGAI